MRDAKGHVRRTDSLMDLSRSGGARDEVGGADGNEGQQQAGGLRSWIPFYRRMRAKNSGEDSETANETSEDERHSPARTFRAEVGLRSPAVYHISLRNGAVSDVLKNGVADSTLRERGVKSLYGKGLGAVALLSPISQKLDMQTVEGKEWLELCTATTEFHFEEVDDQLQEVRDAMSDGVCEGDMFLTRHSNLGPNHIVFHLMVDPARLTTEEDLDLSLDAPLLLSFRRMLAVCAQYEVRALSFPLLLTPSLPEHLLGSAGCVQRATSVLKVMKSFLLMSGYTCIEEIDLLLSPATPEGMVEKYEGVVRSSFTIR